MNSKYSCWVYQIRAIVVDDDSTISSYIPFRHKHILFSFVLRVCTVSNHDLHSNIRNWSRDHLCIFAKLTPVHTTDVKDFAKLTEIIRKKHQTSKFLKDYIRLLRLFLYICSISLVVKPIGLPRDNRTLRSKPISQFFSVVTVLSLSHWSLPARQRHTFLYFSNTPNWQRMRKFTSLLLLGFALGSFAQTPGGVSGSELWFKTAPLNSDLQGYYRWQDFSGDSIRLMLLDSRGVKSELTLPNSSVHYFNFNPSL